MRKVKLHAIYIAVAAVVIAIMAPVYAGGVTGTVLPSAPRILVGLSRCQRVTLSGDALFNLADDQGNVFSAQPSSVVSMSAAEGGIEWRISGPGGTAASGRSGGNVLLYYSAGDSSGTFSLTSLVSASPDLSGCKFRGSIVVMRDGDGLLVANIVDVEQYVHSVVSSEMPDGWPLEALKAQAVASRTYALYKTGLTPSIAASTDYEKQFRSLNPKDVRLWSDDQVYRGVLAEEPNAGEAARLTRGSILTYNGLPAAAYFHSEAAGMTEDPRYVWGGEVPYLKAVEEVPHDSPYSWWGPVSFSQQDMAQVLSRIGIAGEPLGVYGVEPGASGRWFRVAVKTGAGITYVKGTDFRRASGVRSLLFSVFVAGNGQNRGQLNPGLPACAANETRTVQVYPRQVAVEGETRVIAGGSDGLFVIGAPIEGQVRYVFLGRGWGHGVGMSQWGARGMALAGSNCSEILMHYYPGTWMEKWW